MKLAKRLERLEAESSAYQGIGLFARTLDALRREDVAELAKVRAALAGASDKPGDGCLIAVSRALLAADDA